MVPDELRALERLASVAQVGGFRPPSTPLSSWIASVLLGAPGETWPVWDGRPMWPLCQILIEELPAALPAPLADVALLTLFLDFVDMPSERPRTQGWELRTYATTDGLVPLVEPDRDDEDFAVRPFPVLWRPRVELPSRDDAPWELLDLWDGMEENVDEELLELDGLKVGGWPSTVQGGIDWHVSGIGRVDDVEFVLQVDTDDKAHINIVDSGVVYVGWSPTQGWMLTWQCM
jgi:uncharacterized protein DUF1963